MADQTVRAVGPLAQAEADVFDVSSRGDVPMLRKHAVGLAGVLFLTVTGSAPISAMLFNTPLVVGFGNGLGAAASFMFATVILTIFSVGYVAMSRKVTTAGGFYSYISHGLGRELGLGTGFGAVVAYSVFEASLCGGFAFFLNQKLSQIGTATGAGWLNGIQWSWVGFEMAPNYGEESRDPKRIVPMAMYISVIGLGVFYVLTSWAPFAGYATLKDAIGQAQTNAGQFYLGPAQQFIGLGVDQALSVLIITGSFACGMAFHNTAARYFYSLGREKVLPAALGRTHPHWKSPHVASITQSVIAAVIVVLFAIFAGRDNPNQQAYLELYGLMAVMGVIVILAIQALVSVAILVYFWRHHGSEVHWWSTVLAPVISFIGQAVVLFLLIQNFGFIASGLGFARWLGPIDLLVIAAGIGLAFYLKSNQPEKYNTLGRLIHENL